MNFELEEISLQEAVEFVVDNRGKSAPTVEKGIKLIATSCISNTNLYPSYEQVRFVSLETYENWFRSHPQTGDIILTNKGSQNGAICLVPDPVDFCIAQDMVALRANQKKIDPLYLFAALRSNLVQSRIKNLNFDAVIPHFKKTDFDKLLIPLPTRCIQEKIGEFYYNTCLKIELNRRMNETLEEMARAIFKDWFIDFGPTRAKQAGRAPYLPEPLWSLFPEAIDDETGLPIGWREGTIGECFNLTMGQSPPGSTYNDTGEGLPFFQGRTDFGFRFPENRKYCSAPTRIAEPDDTLISVRAPVGDINMAWERCCIGRGVSALRHKSYSRSFTYYSAWAIQEELHNYEHTGTVFGAINRNQFMALPTIEPNNESFITLFDNYVASMDDLIKENVNESRTLAETRDRLLPKLMSGEIRVKEAEKMVEEAL